MVEERYDAFVSYRSTAVSRARTIKAALEALGRASDSKKPFQVFLDKSSLRAGDLDAEICSALDRSHALIVLLAIDTVESEYVSKEIKYWLNHGGSEERLFLVRIDDIDLTWDNDRFAKPETIPSALRDVYKSQQKWIDLRSVPRRAVRIELVPIFAAIRQISTESLRLEEARLQRERLRTITVLAVAMAILLALAVAAGTWAVVNMRAARKSAAQAQAEADAAQVILIGATAPVKAAEFALRAANNADSPSIHAAMLYAAANARHLLHSIDTGMIVQSGDVSGEVLTVWGSGTDDAMRIYDVKSGSLLAAGSPDGDIGSARMISEWLGVVCVNDRPALIRRSGSRLTFDTIGDAYTTVSNQAARCEISPLADGALVMHTVSDGDRRSAVTHLITSTGAHVLLAHEPMDSAETAKVTASGDALYVAGTHSVPRVYDQARQTWQALPGADGMSVVDHDTAGHFLLEDRNKPLPSWAFVLPSRNGYKLEHIKVGKNARDVAAATDLHGGFTGKVATIDLSGSIRMKGHSGAVVAHNGSGQLGWRPYQPSLTRLGGGIFLAVIGQTATLVNTDIRDGIGKEWEIQPNGWGTLMAPEALEQPQPDRTNPILQTCSNASPLVILPLNSGSLYMTASEEGFRELDTATWDHSAFARDCTLVETAPSLAWRGRKTDDVALSRSTAGQAIVEGEYAAVLSGDAAVEVYTSQQLTTPWRWVTEQDPTVFVGDSERTITLAGDRVVFIEHGKPVSSVSVGDGATGVANSPDQRSMIVRVSDSESKIDRVRLVTAKGVMPLPACDGATAIYYLPPAHFQDDAVAAASAHAVGVLPDGSSVDCATAATWEGMDPSLLDEYVVEGGSGHIGFRTSDEGTLQRAEWSGADRPTTVKLDVPEPVKYATWSADGSWVAYKAAAGVRVAHHTANGWSEASTLHPTVTGEPLFTFLTSEGLLLAMGPDGHLEILDVATGRSLVSDKVRVPTRLTSLSSTVYDGLATVTAITADTKSGYAVDDATLTVPVSPKRLRDELCAIHRIEICRS